MTKGSILITGCSSGIGHHAAHTLKNRGWQVFATSRAQNDVARLADEGLDAYHLDYTDEKTLPETLDTVLKRTEGRLDALFNNGAYAIPGAVEDLPTDALRAIFEANFFGWHSLTRAVLPIMRAQGCGRIVNCSSVLGYVPLKWRGAYVSTKFALEGLTDTLRLEMRGTGIKVISLQPGPIRTNIRQNAIPHFEKWIDWENSARREEYEGGLLKRLYTDTGPDAFELGPDATSAKLIAALESANPRPRYFVTTPTYLMAAARRVLPSRMLDWMLAKG